MPSKGSAGLIFSRCSCSLVICVNIYFLHGGGCWSAFYRLQPPHSFSQDFSNDEPAQQGARANAGICHASCRATSHASSRRGSSLTLDLFSMRHLTASPLQHADRLDRRCYPRDRSLGVGRRDDWVFRAVVADQHSDTLKAPTFRFVAPEYSDSITPSFLLDSRRCYSPAACFLTLSPTRRQSQRRDLSRIMLRMLRASSRRGSSLTLAKT